ncbi:MAG: TetR/AcrR family transcriptional regulator [Bacilli bacterium]|nr:TetR/AcrR family transcriptional regulator [Bacilli bacterium]
MQFNSEVIESRVKHNNRNEILTNAYHLFNERGIENVSIEEIAEKSGMKRRNIYYYYNNKEEIAIEIMKSWYRIVQGQLHVIDTCYSNGYDHIVKAIANFMDLVKVDPELFIFSTQFYDYFRNAEFDDEFNAYTNRVLDEMNKNNMIKEGIRDGSINTKWKGKEREVQNIIMDCLLSISQRTLFNAKHLDKDYNSKIDDIYILIDFLLSGLKAE